jgi:hypothetical protein
MSSNASLDLFVRELGAAADRLAPGVSKLERAMDITT